MSCERSYLKKSKKGGIFKIVREHYLRDDIECSSPICSTCLNENTVFKEQMDNISKLCEYPHYLILDTNVVLHQVIIVIYKLTYI